MANRATQANSKVKVILGIALAGTLIIVVGISAALVFRSRKAGHATLPSTATPIADLSNPQSPTQNFYLFFFDPDSLELVREEREVLLSQDVTERLKQIIKELLAGSTRGLRNTLPKGTTLYEAYVDDQSIAYLDFSRHLTDAHIGGTTAEMLTVKAILQTVGANFPQQIKKVQILIERQEIDTLAGHIDISKPLALAPESRQPKETREQGGQEGEEIGRSGN